MSADKPAKVLLVNDRKEGLLLEQMLQPVGCPLIQAPCGEDALKAALREDIAAILLDVSMPGMDGLQVAGYIQSLEQTRHIPILLITAVGRDLDCAWRAFATGVVDFLFKPLDPFELRRKVEFLLTCHLRDRALRQRVVELEGACDAARHTIDQLSQRLADLENDASSAVEPRGSR
ncbi:response regulator [Streptomyces sp. NPDC093982]|uniref:response regulator n=1 Tax=Streptomyces sp. NPDC093982 TaxID=3155077 RepID=UPI00344926A3